ncbi:hypothetical protein RHMOL_Rhmol13G0201300 [Rhododendron molle]|uniref:Uncharacterized protein n=1 Tax=Rhododendron molle TaxID=49168 RepID=A0ACC0L8K0_RHOML|nr:hypothetical protein RHMOL_Rhmol13G0201300 [Rhododendron molle]
MQVEGVEQMRKMEKSLILFCKYNGLCARVRLSRSSRIADLMKILCGKFSELRRHSFQLFYAIRDHPSTMLYNDEDLEGTSGCGGDVGANSSGIFESGGDIGGSTSKGISFSGQRLVGRRLESMGDVGKEDDLGAMFCPHQQRPRLSDAWKEFIKSVGQLFVGGSEGFRDALRKYSIVYSFEFDFVKNETKRVTTVYKDDVQDKSKKRHVDVVDDLKEYYGVDVSYNRAWPILSADARFFKANAGLFPLCLGVVDAENNNNWLWFMEKLYAKFNQHMGNLLKHGGAVVVHFLSELPNERWANVFFSGQRYGAISSSLAECFNSWILKERELSVVDMVDHIRKKIMKSMCLRRERATKWEQVYSKPIYPVASLWKGDVADCGTSILPPVSKKPSRRPKKKRIRSNGEKVREMKCGMCGKMGNHNKLTCKEDLRPGF